MTIVRTCLRIAAVEAIKGRTWAGTRVFDSNNAPLDTAARESPAPFVTIFTDTDERSVSGRDVFAAEQKLQLVIEFGLGGAIPAGDRMEVGIPATDSAFERALDAIERQVLLALVHDPKSEWGEIWRKTVNKIEATKSERGAETERGSRWAARALTMTLDCVADPPAGVDLDPEHPVALFLDAAKAAEGASAESLKAIAAFIEGQLDEATLPDWRVAQGQLGLTEPEVRGIGIGPPYTGEPEAEVDLAGVAFHPEGPVFDAAAADAAANPADLPEPAKTYPPPETPPANEV